MDAVRDEHTQTFLKILGRYRNTLTRQQLKTLRGQALAGDTQGAMRGLKTILARRESSA